MKILFLDIDGVLNSTKTAVATGGYPLELHEQNRFDQTAITLIRRMCEVGGVKIVLSSAWRRFFSYKQVADAFNLPIIGTTTFDALSCRGEEIQEWLNQNPDVVEYAIVDDDADMLEEQQSKFVQTDGHEGLTWKNFTNLCDLLGAKSFDCRPPSRTAINDSNT